MTRHSLVTTQHWCTCGGAIKVTSDAATVAHVVTAFWQRHRVEDGHQTTDRLTALRARHRKHHAGTSPAPTWRPATTRARSHP